MLSKVPSPPKVNKGRGGRPKGAISSFSMRMREAAAAAGMLPHEFLLMIVRGEPIPQKRYVEVKDKSDKVIGHELIEELVYPDLVLRQDSAKAAAPYYAPRLATQTVNLNGTLRTETMTDEELDSAIKDIQTALGIGGANAKNR